MAGSTWRPVGLGGFEQQADLVAVERQHVSGCLNSLPLKRGRSARSTGETAAVHFAPQRAEQRDELRGLSLQAFEQFGEAALGHQADVLGEHAEQAAGEEAGDGSGRGRRFERLGERRPDGRRSRA
jgi:hypothetical protein